MTNQKRESGISLGAGRELGAAKLLKPTACAGHAALLPSALLLDACHAAGEGEGSSFGLV